MALRLRILSELRTIEDAKGGALKTMLGNVISGRLEEAPFPSSVTEILKNEIDTHLERTGGSPRSRSGDRPQVIAVRRAGAFMKSARIRTTW